MCLSYILAAIRSLVSAPYDARRARCNGGCDCLTLVMGTVAVLGVPIDPRASPCRTQRVMRLQKERKRWREGEKEGGGKKERERERDRERERERNICMYT